MTADYDQIRHDNLIEYGQGNRHLAFLGRLYTDRTHFIFELLQNAEDAGATELSFRLLDNRLEVQHNGRAFTEADVRGICGIDESTKADDLTKIGRFGIGFKSVYAFTQHPEIHSGDEHFLVEGYVRPRGVTPLEVPTGQTLFVFPFDHPGLVADDARTAIGEALDHLDLKAMLFLRSINQVFVSGTDVETGVRERFLTRRSERSDRVTLTALTDHLKRSEWYVWTRTVNVGEQASLRVQIAFKIGVEGQNVEALVDSPLVVFFPTEKETYLGFLAQGPYRTTPARDNIPHHDALNQRLVEETAQLLRTALVDLRDGGLLDVAALAALPLDPTRFPPGSMFRPIYESVRDSFSTEALIPTIDGEHGNASVVKFARGTGLRQLFSAEQFGRLSGRDEPLRWAIDSITEDRTPTIWSYFRAELGIEEVTPEGVVARLDEDFLVQQPNDWVIRFYAFLAANPALWRFRRWPTALARTKPIIRLQDGIHVPPFDSHGSPLAYLPTGANSEFPTVRGSIAADEGARSFLKDLGLTEPDVTAEVLEFVLPRYTAPDFTELDLEIHLQDLQHIELALNEVTADRREELRSRLRNTPFIQAMNIATGQRRYVSPPKVFLHSPQVSLFFESNSSVWIVGDEYTAWRQLLIDLGVAEHPRVDHQRADRRNFVITDDEWGFHRRGVDGFDPSASIDGLDFALSRPSPAKSMYIWNDLLAPNHHLLAGTVETSGQKNFVDASRDERRSVMGQVATHSEWLPSRDGGWWRPDQLSLEDLPDGYIRDNVLAKSLGMSTSAVDDAARQLGVDPALLRMMKDNPERQAAVKKFVADLLSAEASSIGDADAEPAQAVNYRVALQDSFRPPATTTRKDVDDHFSDGTVSNVELRRQRIQDAIEDNKSGEPPSQNRFRQVSRKTLEVKDSATRQFVEEQYAGRCQLCDNTFQKRDGHPYFEALYLVALRHARWIDRPGNVLCLCATCCAKLQHGPLEVNDLTEQILGWRARAEGGGPPQLTLRVCGVHAQLTFTEKHLVDLQEMVKNG